MKKKLQSFKKTLQAGLALLLVAVFIAGIFPLATLPINAATSHSRDEAAGWINSAIGKYWDYDGAYGAQCVDLIYYYYQYLGASPAGGNAINYTWNALPSGWQRIQYYNGFVAQPGDIAVWRGPTEYGHVALVLAANQWTMDVVENNHDGSGTKAANKWTYNYSSMSFYGVIRPDFATTSYSYTSITPGNYYLRNMSSGAFLRVADGVDVNQQNIDAWKPYDPGNTAQMFSITATADGYKMRPLCSSSRVVNAYGVSPASGANVNLYDDVNDSTQWWKFEKVDENCYIIHNTYISSCVLDFVDSGNALISSANGSRGQIWMLIPENHTHTKGQFVYRWSKHPHCNCYVCWTCGMDWADTNEPNKVESCEECYPKVHTCNYSKFLQYQTAHPHYAEYQCPDCGKTKTDTSKTTKMESCKTCYPPAPPSEKNTYYFKETYNKDGTISVLIGIDTAGVVAVQGSVAFNREDLELVSYKDSGSFDSFSGPQTIDVANQDGVMYYFASSATKTNNLTGKIPVFTAVFRPKKDTETTLSGAVESASDTDLNQVSFAVSEKTFPTVDPSPKIVRGDVNGDGEVNAIDGAILSRYLAKWKVEINRANADINGDGEVNSADGALLSRHLAKWNIEYFN